MLIAVSFSKVLKLALAFCVTVVLTLEDHTECGAEINSLLNTLLVVLYTDLCLFTLARLALLMTAGCLPASYLLFYSIARWVLRVTLLYCGVVVNLDYFKCDCELKDILLFIMIVLDILSTAYLTFGCCLVGSCLCALTGLTDTTRTDSVTSSYISINNEEED
jgi:hypothetical protein